MSYVDVVGYQFERVHTGAICWLLDTRYNNSITNNERHGILSKLYNLYGQKITFIPEDIEYIYCHKEYSFGRRLKIDLVIEVGLVNGSRHNILIEMKVDSTPGEQQLADTFNYFQTQNNNRNNLYFLFLLGASHVCQTPYNLHGFKVVLLPDVISLFSGVKTDSYIYLDWYKSLQAELARCQNALDVFKKASNIWNENYFKQRGYRTWFPLYFYIYYHIKKELEPIVGSKWSIYSGSNNPVLNWDNGWKPIGTQIHNNMNFNMEYYWEFNYQDFYLKIYTNSTNKSAILPAITNARAHALKYCSQTNNIQPGKSTRATIGQYVSVYKWCFDFHKTSPKDIAQTINKIISTVHPSL